MKKLEALKRARAQRKPILIFDSKEFSISIIPLNYRILIKLPKKSGYKTINRDFYSDLDHGVSNTHSIANQMINKYFIR